MEVSLIPKEPDFWKRASRRYFIYSWASLFLRSSYLLGGFVLISREETEPGTHLMVARVSTVLATRLTSSSKTNKWRAYNDTE